MEDGLYFRMFKGSRAPSLLPKYATDYIVHKEAVRQVFLNGIGIFLFEHKKTDYPPFPFKLGSYKFTRVKKADEFMEELEKFHFGEIPFHRNDSHNKVAEHYKENNVHFKYTHHWDREESVFHNELKLTALRRRLKKKITTKGGKGQDEQAKADEEARKRDEESQRLIQEAEGWLKGEEEEKRIAAQEAARKAEEDARNEEEERKRKLDEELQK